MKISVEHVEDQDIIASQDNAYAGKQKRPPGGTPTRLLSVALILVAMVAAILLLDAALPLRDLWFHDALLTQMGGWPVLPAMLIFPERPLLPHLPFQYATPTPGLMDGWFAISMLLVAFIAVFAVYLWALRRLPGSVSLRFIICSTLLIGCLYMLIPVVTSPDLFSYIAYARMGVLHNLNPLTTLPTAIRSDPVYNYVFWVDQPSAYGPTWAVITTTLQWMLAIFRNTYIMPMVIALRVTGLIMHLISTRLVWLISGQLQQLNGQPALATRKRIRATLAFAWNPLLLFEACVNAHNDAVLLVFVLLMIWVLAKDKIRKMQTDGQAQNRPRSLDSALSSGDRLLHGLRFALAPKFELLMRPLKLGIERIPPDLRTPIAAACLLALGTCLKINIVLLAPALLCYIWMQAPAGRRLKQAGATLASYVAIIVLFYAPFWQGGAIFNVFRVNPATYRTINSVPDLLAHSYNAVAGWFGDLSGAPVDSPAERFMHTFSTGIFVLLFLVILWRMVRAPWHLRSLRGLIYWMAVVWILYCAIGSPWFWPWYLITFFGLFALLEASDEEATSENQPHIFPWRLWFMRTPWTARLLTISMLTLYCLITAPARNFVHGLPGFQWSDTTGGWAWLLPLAAGAILLRYMPRKKTANS
ncbi:MAG TPA: hypothetical protein VFQ36_23710 [Ktedonobacteraceae bacterium]|nr:hypothetical protein [Ktedonobacteraceae bacterium]